MTLKTAVKMGHDANEVVVLSLEFTEAERLAALLRHRMGLPQVRAAELEVAQLRRREKPVPKQNQSDGLTILLHVVEGRTLLVDKDGLYNSWFCCMAGRNVVLALHGVDTPDDSVASVDAITELVDSRQTSILALHRVGRFLTWQHEPSRLHLSRLAVLREGVSFPYFEPTPEIMVFDTNSLQRGVSSKSSLAASIRTKFIQNAYKAKIATMPILSTLSTALYKLPIQTKQAALKRDTSTNLFFADFEDLGGELERLQDEGDGDQ